MACPGTFDWVMGRVNFATIDQWSRDVMKRQKLDICIRTCFSNIKNNWWRVALKHIIKGSVCIYQSWKVHHIFLSINQNYHWIY